MPVTTITARFMRRVQVRDYEPMEAEITASLTVPEGEEAPSAAQFLIETKEAVMQGLRHKTTVPNLPEATTGEPAGDGPEEVVAEPENAANARKPGKPSPGKKRRTAEEVAEDAKPLADVLNAENPAEPDPAGDLGLADPDLTPEPTTSDADDLGPETTAPEATGPDMSDFDAPTEPEGDAAPINNEELLKIASDGAGKIGPEAIRTIIKGFGATQLASLDPDQRAMFKVQVNDAIAAAKS